MENKQSNLITISSKFYMDYTLNMLTSLKNLGLDNKINTYCLDNDSYKEISSNGFNAEEVKIDFDIVKNPTHYGTKDFNIFMYYKVKVIKSELKNNKFVTYTDGDVVFKKPFDDIYKDSNKHDLISVKDFHVKNPGKTSICAGFMVLKSNFKTKYLFNPNTISKNNFEIHDQEIINSKKKWISYKYLDHESFCNGSYFLENSEKLDPVLIHFNYIVGDDKKEIMKDQNCWYI